jgi:tetratricopeptide (TPR) repeat protein
MRPTVVALAALLVAVPSLARAEEPQPPDVIPEKARALAVKGRAFHDAGDYGNAIIAFKEAYVMAPSAGLLFNLAQAYRLQGNCDDAAMMYRRYLTTQPSPEGRAVAEGHLEAVERCAHKTALRISKDPDAPTIIATDRASGSLFATSPTSHRAEIEKDLGLGLGIGGGVAVSLAVYYAFQAHDASVAVEHAYANGAKWQDIASIDARGSRDATSAKILGIGGGVAITGGVALYLLGKRAEHLAPISVAPTRHGAEVHVAWKF